MKDASDTPWYVLRKDLKRNVLGAGQGNEHPLLYASALVCSSPFWSHPLR